MAPTDSGDLNQPEAIREALQEGLAQALRTQNADNSHIEVRTQQMNLHSKTRIPIRASRADWCAWIWLDEQGEPQTEESGSVHLHDPRAGAGLTVLPGLPWGRPAVLHPRAGTASIWPGWLSWTLLPLSTGHRIEALYCEIQSSSVPAEQSFQRA
ncbi:hypothetical protein [Streptomyces sp. NPDC006285]|uniref:hypothetical protein n=1 Tax=Streptomyces sp. NPDC006285 TaxID=3364742 RepID=UPI00369542A8